MSEAAFNRQRLLELAELHCRDELDDAQLAELEALLRDEPAACVEFGQFLQLHANLEERLLAEIALPIANSEPADVMPRRLWRQRFNTAVRFFARPTPLSMSIAALFIGVVITGMAMVAPPFYRAIRGTIGGGQAPIVAQITGLNNAQWADGQPALQAGESLRAGQFIALASGLAEVTYPSGVRVLLEGDASLRVTDAASAHLDFGQAVAKVPPAGRGFTITAKRLRVVDLGTEFGLAVESAGNGQIVVYDGVVDVFVQRTRDPLRRRLVAGDYLQFGVDGRFAADAAPANAAQIKQLTRALPRAGVFEAGASYDEIVASLRPVVWYRMNRTDGDRLVDSSKAASHGQIVAPNSDSIELRQPGVWDDSLQLRGASAGDYAIVPQYAQTRGGQLTVMAWVWVDNYSAWGSIAKNWGDNHLGQFHFGVDQDGARLSVYVQEAGGRQVGAIDPRPLPLGQWQHVAVVVTGTKLRLYREGLPVATSDCGKLAFPVEPTSLGIGCKLADSGDKPAVVASGFWQGRIDELVICNSALSQAVLQRIAAAPYTDSVRTKTP